MGLILRFFIVFVGVGLIPISTSSQNNELATSSEDLVEFSEEYIELFVEAVHSRELCQSQPSGCRIPLQKRTNDYFLRIKGEQSFLSLEVGNSAKDALLKVTQGIQRETGLAPIQDGRFQWHNYIFLVFVNEDDYRSDPDNYLRARVILSSMPRLEDRRVFFESFLADDIACITVAPQFDDGIIRESQIWIKVDISSEYMARCVTEEFFNAFGFGDGEKLGYTSIFDWPMSKQDDGDLRVDLSPLHLAFLRRLYLLDMAPNQTEQETRSNLK